MADERAILHELRNMIAVMLGYCDLIKQERSLPEPIQRDVDEMHGAGVRAMELVRELSARRSDEPSE